MFDRDRFSYTPPTGVLFFDADEIVKERRKAIAFLRLHAIAL